MRGRRQPRIRPQKMDGSDGSSRVERLTILIISDDPQFSFALANGWQGEPRPSFSLVTSEQLDRRDAEDFDLAIVGPCGPNLLARIAPLERSSLPMLQIAAADERKMPGAILVPRVQDWPQLTKVVALSFIERERMRRHADELARANRELEDQATLGRYMLEMRPNVNNALTSILGNSELMLATTAPTDLKLREQLETVRNMGMRIHEILQRFSSLEKEMRLIGQQSLAKAAKASGGI